jgi:hypothetical protein
MNLDVLSRATIMHAIELCFVDRVGGGFDPALGAVCLVLCLPWCNLAHFSYSAASASRTIGKSVSPAGGRSAHVSALRKRGYDPVSTVLSPAAFWLSLS